MTHPDPTRASRERDDALARLSRMTRTTGTVAAIAAGGIALVLNSPYTHRSASPTTETATSPGVTSPGVSGQGAEGDDRGTAPQQVPQQVTPPTTTNQQPLVTSGGS